MKVRNDQFFSLAHIPDSLVNRNVPRGLIRFQGFWTVASQRGMDANEKVLGDQN